VESKERYWIELSNRFAALENLDTQMDSNRAWETIRDNNKISAKKNLHSLKIPRGKDFSKKAANNNGIESTNQSGL
jgi:hypothetical protein